jgi:hypothetical protein
MAHAWWHTCLTAGDETGTKVPLKLKEGKRGNLAALFRFPHGWTEEQCNAAAAQADQKVLELVAIFRQSQENIVFNPMQGQPSEIPEEPHEH